MPTKKASPKTLGEKFKIRVARATVQMLGFPDDPERSGQGVLVGNGFIVTAAHCLKYDTEKGMETIGGGHVYFEVQTPGGEVLRAMPYFVEAVSDIAILGPLDDMVYPAEWLDAYQSFIERTSPVPLWRGRIGQLTYVEIGPSRIPDWVEFNVHVYTHMRTWIRGKAKYLPGSPHQKGTIPIDTEEPLVGGTSGGPIVNDSGELVGIVSTGGGGISPSEEPVGKGGQGSLPIIRWSLPGWLYREITRRY